MRQFSDNSGRKWNVVVNVGTAKKVRDLLGVDLFKLYGEEAGKLFSDPVLLVNTLFVLCEDQCTNSNVTDIQFGESMVGNAIEDGANALMDAVADFFPSSRQDILRKIKSKGEEISAKAMERADKMLDEVAAKLLAKVSTAGDSVTN